VTSPGGSSKLGWCALLLQKRKAKTAALPTASAMMMGRMALGGLGGSGPGHRTCSACAAPWCG
jgi:hypothetical protein